MNNKLRLLLVTALSSLVACGTAQTEDSSKKGHDNKAANEAGQIKVDTGDVDINKVSEALGHFIGRNLHTSGIHFDLENIIKGMREGATGKPAPMTDADYEKAMAELQQKAFNTVAEANLAAANKFMNENAHAKDVIEITPGLLQYTILEQGKGTAVPEHGTPLINYVGRYLNGTVFGSSENAGGPITVPIDQTIPGFSKGIAGMKEGEKRRLFVHPDVGYGRTGQLPPNSLLIFDIEVVKATSPEKDVSLADASEDDDRDLDDSDDDEDDADDKPALKVDVTKQGAAPKAANVPAKPAAK